jgi:hypothetical protein
MFSEFCVDDIKTPIHRFGNAIPKIDKRVHKFARGRPSTHKQYQALRTLPW